MNTEDNDRTKQNGNNKEENQLEELDLFSFQPFPTTELVSSQISRIGNIIMLFGFLTYFVYTFRSKLYLLQKAFIYYNAPRGNTYLNKLPIANYPMPPIAFAFFLGDPFNQTINDPTIFTFSYQMIEKDQQAKLQEQSVQIPLNSSCRPPWMTDQGFDLLCPSNNGNMSGPYMNQLNLYTLEQVCSTAINQMHLLIAQARIISLKLQQEEEYYYSQKMNDRILIQPHLRNYKHSHTEHFNFFSFQDYIQELKFISLRRKLLYNLIF